MFSRESDEHSVNSLDHLARGPLFTQLEVAIHPLVQLPTILDG